MPKGLIMANHAAKHRDVVRQESLYNGVGVRLIDINSASNEEVFCGGACYARSQGWRKWSGHEYFSNHACVFRLEFMLHEVCL
jgi:hypothetical protein